MKINFKEYSVDELFSSLESVNDERYPDNAVQIYQELLSRLDSKSLDLKKHGYGDNLIDEIVISSLIGYPLTMLLMGDLWNISNELEEKIKRIENMINNK